ncbi:MAG: hypothetical protein A2289_08270 [Deltaproteobacteria bacterium RIFOXYA12_FULL_58_15]|nr:MAG: hypothetical protein A2289_08270 [Deltaproteobacteria bacterium RIFOXYA12_FULL_58_15]OGR09120.1 MAG: hypothetical protein A2341_10905 [Deltaproteobacteria bacterium RIFOXYB12_FULL_58_9]
MKLCRFLVGATLLAIGLTAGHEPAQAGNSTLGTITFLRGDALRAKQGTHWEPIKEKTAVFQGDKLKTKEGARLEATLADGSKLRLGGNSELNLQQVSFGKKSKAKKKVSVKLVVGRVWASVTSLFGSDSKFEVTSPNAVAGVRGTRFAASLGDDGSTTVKVYAGNVLVSNQPIYAIKGHTKANRVEVAGPQEIAKDAWEEMVAGAMKMVQVAANGEMTAPQEFQMAATEDDDWEQWNSERDKLAGISE